MKNYIYILASLLVLVYPFLIYLNLIGILFFIAPFIGYAIGIYVLAPFFLYIHRKSVGRKMRYGFQENSVNISSTKKSRIIFPVLLTINLTFLLSDNNLIYQFFLYHAYSVKMEDTLVISILLFPFLFILSFGIFSAIWCLEDSGISYSNDKAFKGKKKNIQAQNVGNWFDFLLKGYSGIGVIISYISQIFKSSEVTFLMLFLILFPVLLMILSLPVVFLFDSSKKRRNLFMHKIAHKQNIFEIFTVNVEYTEREEGI